MDKTFTEKDTEATAFIQAVAVYQDEYVKDNGVYFQGKETCSTIPAEATEADMLDTKPSQKNTTWTETDLIEKALPFSVEIHEYVAPGDNKGYEIILKTSDGIKNYVKNIGYGVEAESRTFPWRELEERQIFM